MPVRVAALVPAALAAVALAVPAAAGADVFKVTARGDHVPGACTNGDCTLREAVIAANDQAGSDKVKLPSRKPYRLTREFGLGPSEPEEGDLDIDATAVGDKLTLEHPGSGRAIVDATGAEDRAIEADGKVVLRKLTLRDGNANSTGQGGGAVSAEGDLRIIASRVMRSAAGDVGGGIFIAGGGLDLRRSVVTGNVSSGEGGGIFVPDDAGFVITESTLAGNEADQGGGIYTASGVLNNQIVGSTLARNVVTEEGGGVFGAGPSLLVQNSTIADNTADASGGGIYAAPDSGTVLFNATIARNRADADDLGPHGGGGAFVDGGGDFLQSINTLYARNRSTGGVFQDCDAPAPVGIVSSGGNLVTTEQDCPFFDQVEDIVDGQPRIGTLADNGGPTDTIKLKEGSPAINQADAMAMVEVDQRGVERQNPDIGSYERR